MAVRLLQYSDIENAYDDPERIGRLAGAIQRLRDDQTLVCGTGDILAPGILAMETDGGHVRPFFESVEPDFATIGNHDFDLGRSRLCQLIEQTPHQWLVANIRTDDGRPFADGVTPMTITRVHDQLIGLFGVTDPDTLSGHGEAAGLTIEDPVTVASEVAITLRDRNADAVVALSHAGRRDTKIAAQADVDLVLGGHDHDRRIDDVGGTPVIHPGFRGEFLTEVVIAGSSIDTQLHDVTTGSLDDSLVESYRNLFGEHGLDEPITTVDEPIDRGPDSIFPESRIGNLVVDAFRSAAAADVAVCHPLMFRTGPPLKNDVTEGELRATIPFDSYLQTAQLDGAALRSLLASLGAPGIPSIDRELFGHVSGATLEWRRGADSLELVDATLADGAIETTATYTVAAPQYEFASTLYPPLTEERIESTPCHTHEALVAYASEQGLSTGVDGRIQMLNQTDGKEFRTP